MIIYLPWKEYFELRNRLIFADKEDRIKIIAYRFGLDIDFIIFPRNCIYLVDIYGNYFKIFPR